MLLDILQKVQANDLKRAEELFKGANPGREQVLAERAAQGQLNATQLLQELANDQADKIEGKKQSKPEPAPQQPEPQNAGRNQAGKFPAPPRRK